MKIRWIVASFLSMLIFGYAGSCFPEQSLWYIVCETIAGESCFLFLAFWVITTVCVSKWEW